MSRPRWGGKEPMTPAQYHKQLTEISNKWALTYSHRQSTHNELATWPVFLHQDKTKAHNLYTTCKASVMPSPHIKVLHKGSHHPQPSLLCSWFLTFLDLLRSWKELCPGVLASEPGPKYTKMYTYSLLFLFPNGSWVFWLQEPLGSVKELP